jgi:hypothetical protein
VCLTALAVGAPGKDGESKTVCTLDLAPEHSPASMRMNMSSAFKTRRPLHHQEI